MHRSLPALLVAAASSSHAGTVTVEDKALVAAPKDVAATISRYEKEPLVNRDGTPCAFIGVPIALDLGAARSDSWLVTTADACEWAASAAPVWIVRQTDQGFRVVLFHVTYSITVGQAGQNGVRHVATSRSTAARYEEQLWKFDGKVYRVTRARAE